MARNDNTPYSSNRKAASSRLKGEALESELYLSSDNSEYYRQIGNFMFWVATTLAVGAIGVMGLLGGGMPAIGMIAKEAMAGIIGLVSVGTFFGSLHYSRLAAREKERNDTLYSVRQAEDMAYSLVTKLEQKAKEHVLLKDAFGKDDEKPGMIVQRVVANNPALTGEAVVSTETKPSTHSVTVAGRVHGGDATHQWAEYIQATQQVALARD